jgi:hypothetical protein
MRFSSKDGRRKKCIHGNTDLNVKLKKIEKEDEIQDP